MLALEIDECESGIKILVGILMRSVGKSAADFTSLMSTQ
jgi:hypothetical protein